MFSCNKLYVFDRNHFYFETVGKLLTYEEQGVIDVRGQSVSKKLIYV